MQGRPPGATKVSARPPPRRPALRPGLGRGSSPHPPGFQQQRGLGPLRDQMSRHRLGRGGRPGAQQRQPQHRVAQEQPHHAGGRGHDADREARAARSRSLKSAPATPQPAPPDAPSPTSGGGSSSPLLRSGPGGCPAHARPPLAPAECPPLADSGETRAA